MTFGYVAAIACGLALVGAPQKSGRQEVSLQKAIQTEKVDGDLKSAIEMYRKIAQGGDRAAAAKALVRMGQCYEKLGDAEARNAYERAVRAFADQKEAADTARARLAAMGKLTQAAGLTVRQRELGIERGGVVALSHDGRQLALTHPDGKDLVIDVLPVTGGPKREVYRVRGFQVGPIAWTPDGRFLIFGPSEVLGGAKGYMRVPIEGGEAQPIGIAVPQDGQAQFPRSLALMRVHPNGHQLLYTAGGIIGEGGEIWALENFLPKAPK